ncbi:hypothetical protein ACFRH4_25270 [Streptomyces mirabilis]
MMPVRGKFVVVLVILVEDVVVRDVRADAAQEGGVLTMSATQDSGP